LNPAILYLTYQPLGVVSWEMFHIRWLVGTAAGFFANVALSSVAGSYAILCWILAGFFGLGFVAFAVMDTALLAVRRRNQKTARRWIELGRAIAVELDANRAEDNRRAMRRMAPEPWETQEENERLRNAENAAFKARMRSLFSERMEAAHQEMEEAGLVNERHHRPDYLDRMWPVNFHAVDDASKLLRANGIRLLRQNGARVQDEPSS